MNRCFGKAARSSLALASRSLGASFVGSNTASRHTMASLFKLRLCISAALFNRSYTASGMFFNVNVVGMSLHHRATKVVALWHMHARSAIPPLRANHSLNRTFCGMRQLGFKLETALPHAAKCRLAQTLGFTKPIPRTHERHKVS